MTLLLIVEGKEAGGAKSSNAVGGRNGTLLVSEKGLVHERGVHFFYILRVLNTKSAEMDPIAVEQSPGSGQNHYRLGMCP